MSKESNKRDSGQVHAESIAMRGAERELSKRLSEREEAERARLAKEADWPVDVSVEDEHVFGDDCEQEESVALFTPPPGVEETEIVGLPEEPKFVAPRKKAKKARGSKLSRQQRSALKQAAGALVCDLRWPGGLLEAQGWREGTPPDAPQELGKALRAVVMVKAFCAFAEERADELVKRVQNADRDLDLEIEFGTPESARTALDRLQNVSESVRGMKFNTKKLWRDFKTTYKG